MVKPNSILTDNAIDLLAEIIRVTGNHHAPQIVEAALRDYLHNWRAQAEYRVPIIDEQPSTELRDD